VIFDGHVKIFNSDLFTVRRKLLTVTEKRKLLTVTEKGRDEEETPDGHREGETPEGHGKIIRTIIFFTFPDSFLNILLCKIFQSNWK